MSKEEKRRGKDLVVVFVKLFSYGHGISMCIIYD